MINLDFDSLEKISEELFRMRDICGNLPDLKDLESMWFFNNLKPEECEKLMKVFNFMVDVYGTLDICGYDILKISEKENTPTGE